MPMPVLVPSPAAVNKLDESKPPLARGSARPVAPPTARPPPSFGPPRKYASALSKRQGVPKCAEKSARSLHRLPKDCPTPASRPPLASGERPNRQVLRQPCCLVQFDFAG